LLLDLDDFKIHNDTFGHPQGDLILKNFSQILRENVRDFDIICRYGGDEFTVILRDCLKDEAMIIAERIRLACEKTNFPGLEGKITVSIGVASYPEAQNNQDLISFADKSLYEVKRSGRNRVQVFELPSDPDSLPPS